MKPGISHTAAIKAIVHKDLREFARDRLWIMLTPLSLVFLVVTFWFLPDSVDETITVGVCPPELASMLTLLETGENLQTTGLDSRGLDIVTFADEEQLAAAVAGTGAGGGVPAVAIGLAFPTNFPLALATASVSGQPVTVLVFVDAAVPQVLARAVTSQIRELAFGLQAAAAGRNPLELLPVTLPDVQQMILGEDRIGDQVPIRAKMMPMLAILILIIEAVALAGLVAVEIEQRTVTAILVTPATSGDFLLAKSVTGAILALSQGVLFLLATGSFGGNWLLVLLLMLLGAVMMSAVGMIAGAAGNDFMTTLFCSLLLSVPLMIPAFSLLIPGSAATWVKFLPSFNLLQGMVDVVGYGHGWRACAPHLGLTLIWDLFLFSTALFILRRKLEAV